MVLAWQGLLSLLPSAHHDLRVALWLARTVLLSSLKVNFENLFVIKLRNLGLRCSTVCRITSLAGRASFVNDNL